MSEFFAQGGMDSIEELFSMMTTFFIALIPLLYLFRMRGNRERKNEERRRRLEAEEAAIAQKGSQNRETQEDYRSEPQEEQEQEGRIIGILEALLTGQAPGTRVPPTTVEKTVEQPRPDDRDRNQYDHDEGEYVSPYDEAPKRQKKKPQEMHKAAPVSRQPEAQVQAKTWSSSEESFDSSRHKMPSAQSTRPKRVRSVSEGRDLEDNNRPSIGFGFSTGLAETGIPKSPPVVSVTSQRRGRTLKSLSEWQRGLLYAEILGAPRALKKYSEDDL